MQLKQIPQFLFRKKLHYVLSISIYERIKCLKNIDVLSCCKLCQELGCHFSSSVLWQHYPFKTNWLVLILRDYCLHSFKLDPTDKSFKHGCLPWFWPWRPFNRFPQTLSVFPMKVPNENDEMFLPSHKEEILVHFQADRLPMQCIVTKISHQSGTMKTKS